MKGLEEWRANRESRLRGEYSWLALSGLHWLEEGANSFGSAEDNDIVLSYYVPPHLGAFVLEGDEVKVHFTGEDPFPLPPLGAGKPEYLFVGDLRLAVIKRAGQLAVRVWDPLSARRVSFKGCVWFQPDVDAVVRARITPFDPPKPVMVEDVMGMQRPGEMTAVLDFSYKGQELSLEAELDEDGSYSIIFRDGTAGESTYGAGRYLVTEIAEGDEVTIDFNKAYNPPCAFTDYATCPLPQSENIVPEYIEAGERFDGID